VDFKQAQAEYQELKTRFAAGEIDVPAFEQAVNRLVVVRSDGVRWRLGVLSGQWYRESDGQWEPASPDSLTERMNVAFPPGTLKRLLVSGLISMLCVFLIFSGVLAAALIERPVTNLLTFPFQPTFPPGVAIYQSPTVNRATITPTPSFTPTITGTPQPSATPTITPTVTFTARPPLLSKDPNGPWLVLRNGEKLTAASADGSVLADLPGGEQPLQLTVAPKGGWIAWITAENAKLGQGLVLHVLKLPDLTTYRAIPISTQASEPGSGSSPNDPAWQAVHAVLDFQSLAWSPDGLQLAFIGLQDGPTADLYLYSPTDRSLVRVDEHPGQAYAPNWSPDSRFIVFFGADHFDREKGLDMVGAWVVEAGSQVVRDLYSPGPGGEFVDGWALPRTVAVHSFDPTCKNHNLRLTNTETMKSTQIFPGCFQQAAIDPATSSVMIAVDQQAASACKCATGSESAGTYLVPMGLGLPQQLGSKDASQVAWSQSAQLFFTGSNSTWSAAYSVQGAPAAMPASTFSSLPILSPAGGVWAWQDTGGVYVLDSTGDRIQVLKEPAGSIVWAPESQVLYLFTNRWFQAAGPSFSVTRLQALSGPVQQAEWVWP
jgi:hypothetical protein